MIHLNVSIFFFKYYSLSRSIWRVFIIKFCWKINSILFVKTSVRIILPTNSVDEDSPGIKNNNVKQKNEWALQLLHSCLQGLSSDLHVFCFRNIVAFYRTAWAPHSFLKKSWKPTIDDKYAWKVQDKCIFLVVDQPYNPHRVYIVIKHKHSWSIQSELLLFISAIIEI